LLSVCSSMSNPTKILTEHGMFEILPIYLPYDEKDAAVVPFGLIMQGNTVEKELIAFLWQAEESQTIFVRVGGQVFNIPHTSSERIKIHIEENERQGYELHYCTAKAEEWVLCIEEQKLQLGIMTVEEITETLMNNPEKPMLEPFAEMKKLGSPYLKTLGIDMDKENDAGVNLIDVVAKYGNIEMTRNLLDAGANIFAERDEPTFVMIAGEGDPSKHKAVLKEFLERHRDAEQLDITNKHGQTALHRAVKSKNQVFVKELVDLNPSIKDHFGKTPKDYTFWQSDIWRLLKAKS